jgi:Leucine-rich repeat (LRR) protein
MEQGRNVWCSTRVKIWTGVAGIVVLVVVVATVLGTVLPRVLDPATSPSTTTTSPQQGDLQELEMLLSSVSFDNGTALHTQSTPQNDALTWLADNANLGNYTDKQKIQRYILAVLFYSTNGKGWQNRDGWLSDDDECLWYNLANSSSCDVNGSVMELDLTDNRLVGKIPNELAMLSESTRHLDLASNSLSGALPSEVGFLTQLTYLGLFSNSLTGVIPSEIGSLSNLLILRLWGNSLMGTIPSQIALLSKLHELSLNANSLTGTILKDIGLMTNLDWLDLSSNNLMGSIPSEIALLTNLNWLRLHDNNLMGEFTCPALIEMCRISCDTNSDACRSL